MPALTARVRDGGGPGRARDRRRAGRGQRPVRRRRRRAGRAVVDLLDEGEMGLPVVVGEHAGTDLVGVEGDGR